MSDAIRTLAVLACGLFGFGCATMKADPEAAERSRLQAEHESTLQLRLHGHVDDAILDRGIATVSLWWNQTDPAVVGNFDAHGNVSLVARAYEVRDPQAAPLLHVTDRLGVHWYCTLDLGEAPPTGAHDLGELHFEREMAAPTVVDDEGRPLAGALVLLDPDNHREGLQTVTDTTGKVALCRALPFGAAPKLVVRHADFAPWWGEVSSRIPLDHGGSVRGRVVLPPTVAPADVVVGTWIEEAAVLHTGGDRTYAEITTPIEADGRYELRNVPPGRREVFPRDRLSSDWRGDGVEVDVVGVGSVATDLAIDTYRKPTRVSSRIRLVDESGQPVAGSEVSIHTPNVTWHLPMHRGYFDFNWGVAEPFGIKVSGYVADEPRTHRNGETIRLRGGHRVAIRLALDAARRLPRGGALFVEVIACEDVQGASAHCVDNPVRGWWEGAPLRADRDANLLVEGPGCYRIDLRVRSWDAEQGRFDDVSVDVTPREFEALGAGAIQVVAISSAFAKQ